MRVSLHLCNLLTIKYSNGVWSDYYQEDSSGKGAEEEIGDFVKVALYNGDKEDLNRAIDLRVEQMIVAPDGLFFKEIKETAGVLSDLSQ